MPAMAKDLWLILFFVAGSSSAKVRPYSATKNRGGRSQIHRPLWAQSLSIRGRCLPKTVHRRREKPRPLRSEIVPRRRSKASPSNLRSSRRLLAASSASAPAKRAECTPGAPPPRASTSRPESSANTGSQTSRAVSSAFLRALA